MVNNKGWIRIVEVTIVALLIIGVAAFVVVNRSVPPTTKDLTSQINIYLEEISKNSALRAYVIDSNEDEIQEFLNEVIKNPLIESKVEICDIGENCFLDVYPPGKEVYSNERIITGNPGETHKKIKIFLWIK